MVNTFQLPDYIFTLDIYSDLRSLTTSTSRNVFTSLHSISRDIQF